jgi:hypothetical protein
MSDQQVQHVERLLHQIRASRPPDDGLTVHWIDDAEQAEAVRDDDRTVFELRLPVIRSDSDYATCLHEIGHILGRYQDSDDVVKIERAAWAWARNNALTWTPDMKRIARESMNYYRALHSRGRGRM